MKRSVEIRVAESDDCDALSDIGLASFRAAYEGTCSAQELEDHLAQNFSASVIRDQFDLPACTYIMASVDGTPAAFAKLRAGDAPDAIPGVPALEIQQFYVSPGHQRLGLGGRLMEAAVKMAGERAFAGAWLSVWENANWATSFYIANGFVQVGTTNFVMGSTIHDDFVMWRPVTRQNEG